MKWFRISQSGDKLGRFNSFYNFIIYKYNNFDTKKYFLASSRIRTKGPTPTVIIAINMDMYSLRYFKIETVTATITADQSVF